MKQELEQAAEKSVPDVIEETGLLGDYLYLPTVLKIIKNAFKAGAKWQKKQLSLELEQQKNVVYNNALEYGKRQGYIEGFNDACDILNK